MKPHIKLEPSPDYQCALICGAPERAALISERLEGARALAKNREYHSYLGTWKGRKIIVMSHGVGAPGAAIGIQELIDCGAGTIIRLGTAGGLYDDTKIGDMVVATSAVRKDGLSQQMIPLAFPAVADLDVTRRLIDGCAARKLPFRSGVVVTSDLFYPGMIDGELELYSKAGAVAVEMECSALFVVASLRGIRAGSVLCLDGNPLKWEKGQYDPHGDAMKKAISAGIDVCLDTLATIS